MFTLGSQLCPPSRWGLLLEQLGVCFRGFPCQELPTRQTLSVVVMGLPERMEVLTSYNREPRDSHVRHAQEDVRVEFGNVEFGSVEMWSFTHRTALLGHRRRGTTNSYQVDCFCVSS